jgi:hypothetical protein
MNGNDIQRAVDNSLPLAATEVSALIKRLANERRLKKDVAQRWLGTSRK